MRTTDRPEDFDGLGPVKRPEPKPQQPQKVRDGVFRGTDGKLYTDIPPAPPQPVVDWFKGYCP